MLTPEQKDAALRLGEKVAAVAWSCLVRDGKDDPAFTRLAVNYVVTLMKYHAQMCEKADQVGQPK